MARRVSSPVVVGRDDDLATAREVLQQAAGGETGMLLVGGEAGIGKSRLLGEILATAGATGFTVLSGSCIDLGEGAPPFAPIADAVRRLRRTVGDEGISAALGQDTADLASLLPGSHVGLDWTAQPAPGRVFEAILELLEGLADTAPVLLTVEDAHWADQSSRDLLAYLGGTLSDARVAIVVTFRTDELHRRHPLRALLAELEREPGVVRLDLRPLSRGELSAQLAAIQGTLPDPDLLESIWDRSEGNPFYAEELLLADQTCERLPASVREGTLARVGTLPETHQAVLRVAAAAGREVSDTLLLELTELPRDGFHRIMRDLVGASLLVLDGDAYRFRHALLQEVVYDELLPGERVRLHVRVAEHLTAREHPRSEDAGVASELAHHWSRANRSAEALTASVSAGIAAEAVGAPGDAVTQYARALELWDVVPDAADRSELPRLDILERASAAAMNVGRFDLGMGLVRDAIAIADADGDHVRAGLLHQRLGRSRYVADLPGAVEELERGVALVPAEPVSVERAQVLAGHAQVLMLVGRLEEARASSLQALDAARAVGDRRAEGHARNTLGTLQANLGEEGCWLELRNALSIAEEVRSDDDIGRAYVNLTHGLAERGLWDELLEVGPEGLAATRRLGIDRTHGVYVEANLVEALIAVGRWDDAVAAQRSLASRLPSGHWEYFGISPVTADRGDGDEVRDAVERAGRLPDHHTAVLQGLTGFIAAQVASAVWERRPADARPLVDDLLHRLPESMLGWQSGPVLWRAVWAEADGVLVARTRQDEEAMAAARAIADARLAVLRSMNDRAGNHRWALPAVGFEGYLALAEAERHRLEGEDQAAEWEAAAARFDALRIVFPAAYARYRRAETLVRSGDRTTAAEVAQRVAGVARGLGARPLLELVELLITRGRLGARPLPDESVAGDGLGLSPREHEVLVLVAAGRTNREIAEMLYISPKTASVHVSNILAKLGVSGRVEAAAVAHRLGLAH